MASELWRIEKQLYDIALRMPNSVDKIALCQIIQCALYKVRGQENDPHAKIRGCPKDEVQLRQEFHPRG